MKAILKVILLLALVQVGYSTMSGGTSEEISGSCSELTLQYHQDNKVETPTCDFISSFGECAPVLVFKIIQHRVITPSGNPTSSASPFWADMNIQKSKAVSISPHRERQYDVDAPFYCVLPNGYYVFALRRIIV